MILGIGHIALDAYRFDETLDFYTRILGFEEMFRLQNDAGELWIIYLRINDSVFLELFPKKGEVPPADRRFSHFCLEVDNIEAVTKSVVEQGVTLNVPIQTGKDGNKQAWIRDPEGNRIEFMQLAPDSLQTQAIARLSQGR